MKRFRFRPTYSNVVATLALFFALAGGAWAATQLPKESVGSIQLKNGAVTPGKLSSAAKSGMTGAKGEAGPQGALGPRGNEGPRGENGTEGATGPQGIRGATGATGATGLRGEPGEPGERGITGQPGPTGATGLRGEPGERGEAGERGERGLTGQPGATGAQGEQGVQGQRGLEGPPGAEGARGEEGHRGPRGEPGEEGKQGLQGEPGPTGPSDAYFDLSEPQAVEITHESTVVLKVKDLPAGEYTLQAALTAQGVTEAALAECTFGGIGPGVAIGEAEPFSTNVTPGDYASLAGLGTAVLSEPGAVYVACGAAAEGTSFVVPAETGHLTVTKVGALHPPAP